MDSATPFKSSMDKERSCQPTTPQAGTTQKGHNPHFCSDALPDYSPHESSSRATWRVVSASAGDHALIHPFLQSVFHGPSAAEFQHQLEEPAYEPLHRLVVKDGQQIVAHLRIMYREMRFGQLLLPLGLLTDLATLPQYRGYGCASALLTAARRILLREGIAVAMLATERPSFYQRQGWFVCGRHSYSNAPPRSILSHLKQRETEGRESSVPLLRPLAPQRYNIRLWRRVELAALMRLYEENARQGFGELVRSDAYWRWLAGAGGSQRIYVAINGPDKFELDESLAPIVGYAATQAGRILEIMSDAGHPEAGVQLLGRACSDAIEKDFVRVRLDGPPAQPLHQLLVRAGGTYNYHEADQGRVFMANIFKPRRFLRLLAPELARRAREAGLPRPSQLGLLIQGDKYRLSVSRRAVELEPGALGRSYLRCSLYEFNQLLMGHLDVDEMVSVGRFSVSTRVAREMAQAFFPRLPLWRPPWDLVPVD